MPETSEPNRTAWASRVGLVIPTLNAGGHVDRMLPALRSQTLSPARFLVIDSSSRDDTVARFRAAGADVRIIAAESFDHGATRQMAVDILTDAEFIIFLTQDAIPAHPEAFSNLIAPFANPDIGLTYGRQLPAPGAGPVAAHARLFNYPERSHVRTMGDVAQFGVKTAFCSNSFAAYRRTALMEIGGFPKGTIFGEDMLVAASLLQQGWSTCYAAEAKVYHSHDHSMADEFRRYFDVGVLHGSRSDVLGPFDRMGGEGLRFLMSEMTYLRTHAVHLIPLALLRTGLKYGGYRLGRLARHLPKAVNRQFSLNRRYWGTPGKNPDAPGPKRHSAEWPHCGR
jgi:GT2 family glycosyltransferase